MIIHKFEQGSEDWFDIRLGRVGGSEAEPFLTKSESIGPGIATLVYKKVAEKLTGQTKTFFVSEDMQRGTDLEPLARKEYENKKFTKVDEVGYISKGDFFGVSPDGLVGDDGMIEIKCPSGAEYIRFFDSQKIKKAYIAQIHWSLWITGRKWCDLFVYNPDFEKCSKTIRIFPDKETFDIFEKKSILYIERFKQVALKMGAKI